MPAPPITAGKSKAPVPDKPPDPSLDGRSNLLQPIGGNIASGEGGQHTAAGGQSQRASPQAHLGSLTPGASPRQPSGKGGPQTRAQ